MMQIGSLMVTSHTTTVDHHLVCTNGGDNGLGLKVGADSFDCSLLQQLLQAIKLIKTVRKSNNINDDDNVGFQHDDDNVGLQLELCIDRCNGSRVGW